LSERNLNALLANARSNLLLHAVTDSIWKDRFRRTD